MTKAAKVTKARMPDFRGDVEAYLASGDAQDPESLYRLAGYRRRWLRSRSGVSLGAAVAVWAGGLMLLTVFLMYAVHVWGWA